MARNFFDEFTYNLVTIFHQINESARNIFNTKVTYLKASFFIKSKLFGRKIRGWGFLSDTHYTSLWLCMASVDRSRTVHSITLYSSIVQIKRSQTWNWEPHFWSPVETIILPSIVITWMFLTNQMTQSCKRVAPQCEWESYYSWLWYFCSFIFSQLQQPKLHSIIVGLFI